MKISKQTVNEVYDTFKDIIEPATYKVANNGWYGEYEKITDALGVINDILASLDEQSEVIATD